MTEFEVLIRAAGSIGVPAIILLYGMQLLFRHVAIPLTVAHVQLVAILQKAIVDQQKVMVEMVDLQRKIFEAVERDRPGPRADTF